jgi:hydroxymethylglutaryl-CoA lyase
MERIARRPGVTYRALVPNARGAARAAAAHGVGEMLGLITVSAAYLRKNQNMSIDQAVAQAIEAFGIAERAGAGFVMALGMAFWCPYEGPIPEEQVFALLARFWDAGMRRFYLAGSVGMEDPRHVNGLFRRIRDRWPEIEVGFHVHNLAGLGAANILAALDGGATSIEGAICGIGGGMTMPSTMGSVGNLASEDVVYLLNEMGIETGLDTASVVAASRDVAALLEISPRSHVAHSGTRADIRAATK